MHLTVEQCREDAAACVRTWLFKSTTAFYQHGDWHLPAYFGIFCCNYAVAGVVLLLTKPEWVSKSRFPYTCFALVLIFVQGTIKDEARIIDGW